MVNNRDCIKNSKRWVVKIGSALLTANGNGLDKEAIALWVKQIVHQLESGIEIIIVSSGAVAEGMSRLAGSKDLILFMGCKLQPLLGKQV